VAVEERPASASISDCINRAQHLSRDARGLAARALAFHASPSSTRPLADHEIAIAALNHKALRGACSIRTASAERMSSTIEITFVLITLAWFGFGARSARSTTRTMCSACKRMVRSSSPDSWSAALANAFMISSIL